MNWPNFLPYPISWIRAFTLTYVFTALVWSQFPFRHSESVLVALIGAWVTVPFLFTFFHWVIASAVRLFLKHLPAHPKLDSIRQYLLGRLPALGRSHWREGLNAFIVGFVAFIASVFFIGYLLPVPGRVEASEYGILLLRRNILYLRREMIPIGMFLASVCLYQYDLWIRHRRAVKSAAKAKAQKPTKKRSPVADLPPVNPIETELNQLAAELGDSRMRPVRRTSPAPKSEKPQWYVFRSGKPEGPYTKDQLRDVQQISDRTKVRREQDEWQRAGEIPELASYLTQK
jgi:GYF domain 2